VVLEPTQLMALGAARQALSRYNASFENYVTDWRRPASATPMSPAVGPPFYRSLVAWVLGRDPRARIQQHWAPAPSHVCIRRSAPEGARELLGRRSGARALGHPAAAILTGLPAPADHLRGRPPASVRPAIGALLGIEEQRRCMLNHAIPESKSRKAVLTSRTTPRRPKGVSSGPIMSASRTAVLRRCSCAIGTGKITDKTWANAGGAGAPGVVGELNRCWLLAKAFEYTAAPPCRPLPDHVGSYEMETRFGDRFGPSPRLLRSTARLRRSGSTDRPRGSPGPWLPRAYP